MSVNINVNGKFVEGDKSYINVDGVWKEALEFHQVQNNQWVKLFPNIVINDNILLSSDTAILGEYTEKFGFDEFEIKDNPWGRNLLTSRERSTNNTNLEARQENGVLYWKQKTDTTYPFKLSTHALAGASPCSISFKSQEWNDARQYINTPASGTVYGDLSISSGEGGWRFVMYFESVDIYDYINFYGTNPSNPPTEFSLWDLKIEKGDPTPYSPTPENLTQGYQYSLSQGLGANQFYTFSTNYSGKWQGLWIDNKYVGYLNNGKITFKSPIAFSNTASVIVKVLDSSIPITQSKLELGENATEWTPSPED